MLKYFAILPSLKASGIPIVEALSCGIPVVAATGSCLREAGGPAQFYTDPEDPAMLATLLEAAVCDTSKREDMIRGEGAHSSLPASAYCL